MSSRPSARANDDGMLLPTISALRPTLRHYQQRKLSALTAACTKMCLARTRSPMSLTPCPRRFLK